MKIFYEKYFINFIKYFYESVYNIYPLYIICILYVIYIYMENILVQNRNFLSLM